MNANLVLSVQLFILKVVNFLGIPNIDHALRWAAKNGRLTLINLLLEIPEVLVRATVHDNSALRLAAENGHLEVVNRLLEIPEVLARATALDNRALHLAAQEGKLSVVNRLLEIPEVLAQAAVLNNCILSLAVEDGYLEVVNRLLEIPEVLAQATALDNKALHFAAMNGYLEVVNRLLEIPEVSARATALNNRALHLASQEGKLSVVNCLLKIPEVLAQAAVLNNCVLRLAAQDGHSEVVKRLLEIPEVLAQVTVHKNYALRLAAQNGHLAVVNRLLELPKVRQNRIDLNYGIAPTKINLIMHGLTRALWLSLQTTPGFINIGSLQQLTAFAHLYLQQHPHWVHPSFSPNIKAGLVKSLPAQVLHLAYYSPLIMMQKYAFTAIVQETGNPCWSVDIIKHIEAFVGPQTPGSQHFSEAKFKPTQKVALHCLQYRYLERAQTSLLDPQAQAGARLIEKMQGCTIS